MSSFRKNLSKKRLQRAMIALLPQINRSSFAAMGLIVCLLLSRAGFVITISCSQRSTVDAKTNLRHSPLETINFRLTSPDEICGLVSLSKSSSAIRSSSSGCRCSDEKKQSGTCCCSSTNGSSSNGCCSNKVSSSKKRESQSCCSSKTGKTKPKQLVAQKEKKQTGPAWKGCICGMSEFSFYTSFSQPMFNLKPVHAVSHNKYNDSLINLNEYFQSLHSLPETPPPQFLS